MTAGCCDASVLSWLGGFAFSIFGGWIAARLLVGFMRLLFRPNLRIRWLIRHRWQRVVLRAERRMAERGLYWFTATVGFVERFAITLVATYSLSGAASFAVAWIGLKMLSNWNRPAPTPSENTEPCRRYFSRNATAAMCGSLVSAGFALFGALIICGKV